MLTLIYFIFILGFIVLIHEGGHFFFAKRAGIYVYEFSIGMGPKIFKWKRKGDETQYSIGLFPIGGYVQMAGESVEVDENIPKDQTMQAKTWLQRFLTIIAGVMMNFILALIIFFVVALLSGAPDNKVYIGDVLEGSAASGAGIEVGDVVTKLNGKKVKNADKFLLQLTVKAGEKITLELDGKKEVTLISGTDLIKSIFSGYPGAYVGIGNCLVTTREDGKADVTYVGEDSALTMPAPISYPCQPSFTETLIAFNAEYKGE
jgi:regulator of sigma E protease